MKKQVIHFAGMEFNDIPRNENPAFSPDTSCYMVCNAGNLYEVLDINPVKDPLEEDSVTRLGMFWELGDAFTFAHNRDNQKYNMCIGEASYIHDNTFIHGPATTVTIGEEVKDFINQYANVEIRSNGEKEYIINKLRFSLMPVVPFIFSKEDFKNT